MSRASYKYLIALLSALCAKLLSFLPTRGRTQSYTRAQLIGGKAVTEGAGHHGDYLPGNQYAHALDYQSRMADYQSRTADYQSHAQNYPSELVSDSTDSTEYQLPLHTAVKLSASARMTSHVAHTPSALAPKASHAEHVPSALTPCDSIGAVTSRADQPRTVTHALV